MSCSRILPRRHILVIPRSNLVTNEDYTIIGNRGGVFIQVVIHVPFIWIWRLFETLKERGVLLFSWFTSFHFSYKVVERAVRVSSLVILLSGANLALRRIANEDTGDQGKVFVCVIFVWFVVHLDFLSGKHFLRTRHLRTFLFGHLPFANCEGRSLANDRCRLYSSILQLAGIVHSLSSCVMSS